MFFQPTIAHVLVGINPSEEAGTLSLFGFPEKVKRSPAAKAVWLIACRLESSMLRQGILDLDVTPPADAPIGEYLLTVEHKSKKAPLATLALLFNPWCPGRSGLDVAHRSLSPNRSVLMKTMVENKGLTRSCQSNNLETFENQHGKQFPFSQSNDQSINQLDELVFVRR